MSGEYGKLYKRAWGDRDFKALTAHEQLQYLKLISQPDVSMAGILTHAAMRWAGQTADLGAEDIERALEGLERKRFVAYDRDTQELLIRSYIRNDGGWKSPLTMKGIRAAVERVLSVKLRRIISSELTKIDTSDLSEKVSERYNGTVKEYVEGALIALTKGFPPLDVWACDTPSDTPTDTPSEGLHDFAPLTPSTSPAPSPATAPSPAERGDYDDKLPVIAGENSVAVAPPPSRTRGSRLPKDWFPARDEATLRAEAGRSAEQLEHELEKFRDHWASAPGSKGVKADWNATWRNWIKRAAEWDRNSGRPRTAAAMSESDWASHMQNAIAADERDAS